MSKIQRIAVKIGSNVLTRADGSPDFTRMSALVDQVAALHTAGIGVIMVSSGAVAAGRGELSASVSHRLDPVSARQLYSAVGQAKLIDRYVQLFRDHGIVCGQVLTTKENFATRHHYLNQQNCMEVMLREGVVPVVNENDTVSVTELMFTDNDELSGLIAMMMRCDRLIILSNIDGIFTGDPSDPANRLIDRVQPGDDLSQYISAGRSSLGRGGMSSKYGVARRVAESGIGVIIANGRREGILTDLVPEIKAPCTYFEPSAEASSGVKRWIASSGSFAKGLLRLNARASEAIASRPGTSVLAVGVTAVEGNFTEGDIVEIADNEGNVFAWGRAGEDSATAAARVGVAGGRPLVHTDYLYINEPTPAGQNS